MQSEDTIAAIATPPGNGGVGIIRLSGSNALPIAEQLCQKTLEPRKAIYSQFHHNHHLLDDGIVLYFPGPQSFTGEDIVELQGHGGLLLQKIVLKSCLDLGARQARPGEFSERAFLNNKIDLTQAEAIADLISASTEAGVKAARRSLSGAFSEQIRVHLDALIQIRVMVESALDFPDEDIDFAEQNQILSALQTLHKDVGQTLEKAKKGRLIQEGARVVLLGLPNAGKSSLLNYLSGESVAIVTDIAGTTRDTIEQRISLGGAPIQIIDTAGLNATPDNVEKIGIQRAIDTAQNADLVIFLKDALHPNNMDLENAIQTALQSSARESQSHPISAPIITAYNKADLLGDLPNRQKSDTEKPKPQLMLSAKTGQGVPELLEQIQAQLGLVDREPEFSARERHINALVSFQELIHLSIANWSASHPAELLAEDLRQAQAELGQITGAFSADDLLGEIFSSFCIGK